MSGIRRVSSLGTQGVSTIVDGSVQSADIANNAVTQAKLASSLSGTTITTSALRSTAIPSPFAGQSCYETDTNRFYVWNGSSWVIPNQSTINPNGLELIHSADFSGQKNVIAPAGTFSSTYNEYKIYLNISNFVSTGVCWLQMGFNNSFEASAAYRYGGFQSYSDSNITGAVQSSGAIGFLMQDLNFDDAVHKNIGTTLDLFNPFDAIYTTASNITYVGINPQYYGRYLFQKLSTSASYNQCRISYSGTSITGSIRIYGYRK